MKLETGNWKFDLNKRWIVLLLGMIIMAGCAAIRGKHDLSGTEPGLWVPIFDGADYGGWVPFVTNRFETGGPIEIKDNAIHIGTGLPYSAVTWGGELPKNNYEFEISAMRTKGYDIFCGILFPVGTNYCSMVLGGWGNSVAGLSCIDWMVAADNETGVAMSFSNNVWYAVRLKVTDDKIETWVDGEKIIDQEIFERNISPYFGLEMFAPFGIFTYETAAAVKDMHVRRLDRKTE